MLASAHARRFSNSLEIIQTISRRIATAQKTQKMATKYKLTYFPITGLGEAIRFLLAYGNIEFEDFRFKWEDWPKIKETMPFGKVPVLEMDGKVVHQSAAICRYLAKKMDLAGKDDMESLQIDMIVDTLTDLRLQVAAYYYDPNEVTRAAKYDPLMKETLPFFLSRFDKIVGENDGYFVGGRLSWADLNFVGIGDYLSKLVGKDIYSDYPNLMRMKKNVESVPQIKAWIEKRPDDVIFKFGK